MSSIGSPSRRPRSTRRSYPHVSSGAGSEASAACPHLNDPARGGQRSRPSYVASRHLLARRGRDRRRAETAAAHVSISTRIARARRTLTLPPMSAAGRARVERDAERQPVAATGDPPRRTTRRSSMLVSVTRARHAKGPAEAEEPALPAVAARAGPQRVLLQRSGYSAPRPRSACS